MAALRFVEILSFLFIADADSIRDRFRAIKSVFFGVGLVVAVLAGTFTFESTLAYFGFFFAARFARSILSCSRCLFIAAILAICFKLSR